MWTGDNVASDEHMMAGIRLCLSLGLSGVPFTGMDVGGFVGESSPALFARWISIAAFMPLFRIHSMIDSRESDPWSYGEKTEAVCKNYINLRYRLLPTLYQAFHHASDSGLPIMEAMLLRHPNNEKTEIFQHQFYLSCLLVCPQESTKEAAKVYLPETTHYHVFTGEKLEPGEHWVHSPIDTLPVFVPSGSVLLMQSWVPHTDAPHNGTLQVHVYFGEEGGEAIWYEDDGQTKTHTSGNFYQRKISYSTQKLGVEAASGSFLTTFIELKVILHGWPNKAADGWTSETYQFLEELPDFDPFVHQQKSYREAVLVATFEVVEEAFAIQLP